MKMSERVRRGFGRIGLIGLIVGAVAAVCSIFAAIYAGATTTTVFVWHGTTTLELPVSPTKNDVIQAVLSRPKSAWDRDGETPLTEARIALLIDQAAEKAVDVWRTPLIWALGAQTAGAAWLGLWWLLGWIVRGFLD